jgi:hypothetical protein
MDNNFMDNMEKYLKELIKEINTLNQILLSSEIGKNLRNTELKQADKISQHYKEFLNKLK